MFSTFVRILSDVLNLLNHGVRGIPVQLFYNLLILSHTDGTIEREFKGRRFCLLVLERLQTWLEDLQASNKISKIQDAWKQVLKAVAVVPTRDCVGLVKLKGVDAAYASRLRGDISMYTCILIFQ